MSDSNTMLYVTEDNLRQLLLEEDIVLTALELTYEARFRDKSLIAQAPSPLQALALLVRIYQEEQAQGATP